jgi:hypothetical protein
MKNKKEEYQYSKGELVWAKVRGFPWWPGIVVGKCHEEKFDDGTKKIELLINFIGDNSHAKLVLDKVAKYKDNFNNHGTGVKSKKLSDSIRIAN